MRQPALDGLSARFSAAAGPAAADLSLTAVLGRIARGMDEAEKRNAKMQRAVQTILLPAVQLNVASGTLTGAVPTWSLLGPEDGQVWDVRRLTVAGLVGPAGTPISAQGTQTAPGANTQIAIIAAASITPGTYTISWTCSLSGTPGAGEVDNFQLRLGSTTLENSSNPGAVGEYPQAAFGPVYLSGANAVAVRNSGAGTAGAVYAVNITITPVSSGDVVNLFREVGSTGNPENYVQSFSAPGTSPGPTWTPGGGLVLRSPESLFLSGTGLAAPTVTISGEAVAVADDWLAQYLL